VKIRFTRQAARHLQEIESYLTPRSPQGAARVRDAITTSCSLLARFPKSGREQRTPGVRKLVVSRYGYIIYYRINDRDGAVDVVSIRHVARRRVHADN
jgi:toxin ParE1/3/4